MIAQKVKNLVLVSNTSNEQDDEYNIPLDISDIISICKEFNGLGWQIQNQVENILEVGVDESIATGKVNQASLPHIKKFLKAICGNPYFGDSKYQSLNIIWEIDDYLKNNSQNNLSFS